MVTIKDSRLTLSFDCDISTGDVVNMADCIIFLLQNFDAKGCPIDHEQFYWAYEILKAISRAVDPDGLKIIDRDQEAKDLAYYKKMYETEKKLSDYWKEQAERALKGNN